MSPRLLLLPAMLLTFASAAQADSQSSNTSSNSSSDNGIVRERIVDRYCENGYCERYVSRKVYRDDRQSRSYRDERRRTHRERYWKDED